MAWVDDRVWAHPKFTDLTAPAFRCYVYGLCYASGFNTRGYLTAGQVATIGGKPALKTELLNTGLWEQRGALIYIHDWDDHNGKRDARRAADRERKRLARAADKSGSPQDSPQDRSADNPWDVTQDAHARAGSAQARARLTEVTDEGNTKEEKRYLDPLPTETVNYDHTPERGGGLSSIVPLAELERIAAQGGAP